MSIPPNIAWRATVPEAIPASVTEVQDQNGDVWIRKHPAPGLISIPLCAVELFELYAWFDLRSAIAVKQRNPEFWAGSEARAAELLAMAVALAPALQAFQKQTRQHPDGSSREGTA